MGLFLFLGWYTFDDWLARLTNVPMLGEVPLFMALVVAVILTALIDYRWVRVVQVNTQTKAD